jgi:uncharacterized membrane protein
MAGRPCPTFVGVIRSINYWIVLLGLVAGSLLSTVIPPMQSPDEVAHIQRAYLLGEGQILLDAPPGRDSGGMIDRNLSAYLAYYGPGLGNDRTRRVSVIENAWLEGLQWTDEEMFSAAPATAYYFPLIYAPQAIGLEIGKQFGLSIDTSYRLARFVVLCSTLMILAIAFCLYPVSPLLIGLMILPMSAFQFASASLDGTATALAVFAVAAFLRTYEDRQETRPWLLYACTASIVLLLTSRIHLLPMLALVLASTFYSKRDRYYLAFSVSLLCVLVWTLIAAKTTVDTRIIKSAATGDVLWFYLSDPLALFQVFQNTWQDLSLTYFYRISFLGVLGYLDSAFTDMQYRFLYWCALILAALSISVAGIRARWQASALLLVCAVVSVFFIFFALLLTWTPHPATVVHGVQGRYLLIPAIMVAYAVSGNAILNKSIARKLALVLVVALGAFTIFETPPLLFERYFIAPKA